MCVHNGVMGLMSDVAAEIHSLVAMERETMESSQQPRPQPRRRLHAPHIPAAAWRLAENMHGRCQSRREAQLLLAALLHISLPPPDIPPT